MLALLQEECQLQKGTDTNFRTKVRELSPSMIPSVQSDPANTVWSQQLETNSKRWPKVKDPETGKPLETLFLNKRSQQTFTVRHYAGPVEYDVLGFVVGQTLPPC